MKILVTGGTGMVGSAFKNVETDHDLILVGSKDCNLMDYDQTFKMFAYYMPHAVIHLAAKVGGVKGNSEYVSDYFYENIMINTNVLDISKRLRVEKVVSLLSTCIYPDDSVYPLTEDQIHNGEPHKSNFGYAYAKRMLEVQSRAIRQQYNLKYTTAVPNNIYGPDDNFDLENGHVIPAIIRKIYDAKFNNKIPVFWGSGNPLREFTYAKDIAKILLWMIENYDDEKPLNIGNSKEYAIKDLVRIISELFDYQGDIHWDKTMPEGQYRKPSSNSNFKELRPDFKFTDLPAGLSENIQWYKEVFPNIRGLR